MGNGDPHSVDMNSQMIDEYQFRLAWCAIGPISNPLFLLPLPFILLV